ncbi:MAG: type II toxin-antitoxin system VapC family toxin [Rhizobiaceae bacterium]
MIVDASAVLAILFSEPESDSFEEALLAAGQRNDISAVNFLEAAVRVDRLGSDRKSGEFDKLIDSLSLEIVPVTAEQAHLAREAYKKFGKGNHEARLNLGDCFAYALAKARGGPLLFKGDDFRRTDVEPAL